jgi:tetratricopeptide (TPR) repeat protein
MRSIGFLCAASVAFVGIPSIAAAETPIGESVAQALKLHAAGKPAEAYKLLLSQSGANAGNPDFDYALGLAAADSGHIGDAVIALQRVIAVQPNNAQARAELARAYALAGDVDTAKREFDTVSSDPTLPDPVRNRFNRLIRGFDSQIKGGSNAVTGFAEAEGGYDGNINTATDATSITLPVFSFLGPAALSGTARSTDAGFGQIQGGLSGSTAVGRQTRLYLSGLFNWRDNFKSSAFDQASVTGSIGLAHSLHSGDALSLTGQAQRFWLGHKGFRTSAGVTAQYTKRLSDNQALAISAQFIHLNYSAGTVSDANRYGAHVTYSGKILYAGFGGGKEQTRLAASDHLSNTYITGQVGAEYPLSPRMALLAGASIENRSHDANDPLFLIKRKDTQVDGSLGLRYALMKGMSVRPRVTYTRNYSNIALNDYDRVTASIGVRYEF